MQATVSEVLTQAKHAVIAHLKHHGKLQKDSDEDQQAPKKTANSLPLESLAGLAAIDDDLSDVAEDGGQQFIVQLGLPETDVTQLFGQVNDRAVSYARTRAAELVTGIDESTRDMLADDIGESLEANEGLDGLIDRLQDAYAFSEDRAALIARTEVASANQQGALHGMKLAEKAGVKLMKVWVPDAEACDVCMENADASPIPLEDDFPSGDAAPTAHPRCECSLASEIEEENASEDGE